MQALNLGVVFCNNAIPCSIPDGSQSVFHVPAATCVHGRLTGKARATTRALGRFCVPKSTPSGLESSMRLHYVLVTLSFRCVWPSSTSAAAAHFSGDSRLAQVDTVPLECDSARPECAETVSGCACSRGLASVFLLGYCMRLVCYFNKLRGLKSKLSLFLTWLFQNVNSELTCVNVHIHASWHLDLSACSSLAIWRKARHPCRGLNTALYQINFWRPRL